MSQKNKYLRKDRHGEYYTFIKPYMDLMIEAENKTHINRYKWHLLLDEFIFDGIEPVFVKKAERECWNTIINELELYTSKKGKYSINWKGGISDENHKIRTSKKYKEWRLKVFQRDNFTCQNCHKVGGKLNAHHIKHFSKDKDNRLNVDNGITLCEDCHKLVHKLEGR